MACENCALWFKINLILPKSKLPKQRQKQKKIKIKICKGECDHAKATGQH